MKKEKRVLVFNVGSSSIKYSLFKGLIKITSGKFEEIKNKKGFKNSIKKISRKLKDEEINIIAHRVVHGGDIKKPQKINSNINKKIKKFFPLAELHNPNQLLTINICERVFKKPQYVVFDTMFFSEIPDYAKIYAIPLEISKKYNIQKYGFHGISHKYVSKNLDGKTISCHLGSGCSITAIKNKKAFENSMGFTPNSGIMMGTRCGSIDPGVIHFLEKKEKDINQILEKKSGLKGISGYSDFRKILKTINKNKNSKLAYDVFVYEISKKIGSYVAVLNGLDNLVFTAAIGENVPKLRKDVCKNFSFLGVKLDNNKNNKNKGKISTRDSKVDVYVKKTDEEKQILLEVLNNLK
jgi:acetate kinase